MTIRFAGSASVDQRRRRRLAAECESVELPSPDSSSDYGSASRRRLDLPVERVVVDSPVNSIIRPQLWIHCSLVGICLLAWGGLLYLGDLAEQTDFGLREIVGLRSGRLATFFSTLMLLWAGQLALLIFWYRRKSRNDFHGRYRTWLWAAGTLQLFLVAVATGAQKPFSEYMQLHYPLDVPRYDLLCWLVPTATVSLALFRLLGSDMHPCRSSRALLWIAGIAGIAAGSTLLMDGFLPERWQDLMQVGSTTFCHLALASSLLLHARFVIHVNNEAPQVIERRTWWSRLRANLPSLPKLRRRRRPAAPKAAKPDKSSKTPATAAKSENKASAPAKPVKSPAPAQSPTPTKAVADVPLQAAPVTPSPAPRETPQRPAPAAAKAPAPTKPAEPQRVQRVDVPARPAPVSTKAIDRDEDDADDSLEGDLGDGLSKKERRRLRKQQRDQQRSGRPR